MDKICHLDSFENIISFINQAKEHLSPDFLIILLGPTASGKTALAVRIAQTLDAEIISSDSRQVYQHLDIGTGKDLREYGNVPYHLIDIVPPTIKYSVENFKKDFQEASRLIRQKGKQVILCGGTGSYIHSLLIAQPYASIPKNQEFQDRLASYSKEELLEQLQTYEIPNDFHIDRDSKKRLIRALEILNYLKYHEAPEKGEAIVKDYLVLGLNPGLTDRRSKIDRRLDSRLEEGLLAEVEGLLAKGLSHEDLMWFGLEYKYASLYLSGEMSLADFKSKLRTEIHRYAKRQMTFFRKMEKDGVKILWIEAKV
ncbi:tRNA (adenosine(37)-N6)-dimethylallyltransferase MiaA [Sphingobacterium lactis]|uniref:tRNA (adenosine(37)-N6)-dimethylallyltransferase MiaA n=1 Tax=Sphingobacterium lactis TaxID=797291 RepID=UPI003F7CE904